MFLNAKKRGYFILLYLVFWPLYCIWADQEAFCQALSLKGQGQICLTF